MREKEEKRREWRERERGIEKKRDSKDRERREREEEMEKIEEGEKKRKEYLYMGYRIDDKESFV